MVAIQQLVQRSIQIFKPPGEKVFLCRTFKESLHAGLHARIFPQKVRAGRACFAINGYLGLIHLDTAPAHAIGKRAGLQISTLLFCRKKFRQIKVKLIISIIDERQIFCRAPANLAGINTVVPAVLLQKRVKKVLTLVQNVQNFRLRIWRGAQAEAACAKCDGIRFHIGFWLFLSQWRELVRFRR